jgi:glutaredoxin
MYDLNYKEVDGSKKDHDVIVFALSTCAFCRKAISFLKDNDVAFRYIYLDQVDVEKKREVKADLKGRFESVPVFPLLVVDEDVALSGFTESEWREAVGL